ncbi:MAG: type II toxin-antitoxin system HicA family toxin [Patescibacteria group bacterium]
MSKAPSLTPRKVIAALKRNGFQLDHTTGSHFIFYHPDTKRRTLVAYHTRELPPGAVMTILKQAGLSIEDLR